MRMDLLSCLDMDTALVDVTVRNTYAPSRRRNPSAMFKEAERDKTTKYEAMAKEWNGRVVPFVMNQYGKLGPIAKQYVDQLAAFAERSGRSSMPGRDIRSKLLTELCMTNARTSMRIVLADAAALARLHTQKRLEQAAMSHAMIDIDDIAKRGWGSPETKARANEVPAVRHSSQEAAVASSHSNGSPSLSANLTQSLGRSESPASALHAPARQPAPSQAQQHTSNSLLELSAPHHLISGRLGSPDASPLTGLSAPNDDSTDCLMKIAARGSCEEQAQEAATAMPMPMAVEFDPKIHEGRADCIDIDI
jgi:hypothetical protein